MPTQNKRRLIPRVTFEITSEQSNILREHLEFGMQKKVLGAIIEDVTEMLRLYGQHFVIMMLQRKISYAPFMEEYKKRFLECQDSNPLG